MQMAGHGKGLEKQLPLFGGKSLNPVPDLKREMALAAKASGLSRQQIVDQMNVLIEVERLRTRGKDGLVTLDMLNKYLAPEADIVIPTQLIKIFGTVTANPGPAQTLAPEGYRLFGPAEIIKLEFAENLLAGRKAQRRCRRLAEQLEEMNQ